MKRFFILFVICVCGAWCAYAQQNCKVTGIVADNLGETIPYATVSATQGDKTVRRMAADVDGKFVIELPQGKEYTLTITSVGYAPYSSEIKIPTTALYDLGTIILRADTELAEVVVEAQKPLIKSDAEKITYDVTADPEADNKTLLDMMRKVPLVTVDAEDNVQLNGASDFKILINGKESSMMKNNMKDVLKSMPANSVKDIQVITSPSSRYDAEGSGGIINIVTTREELKGFTGSVTAHGSLQGSFGGNVYLAGQYKKFTASLNYSGGRFRNYQYTDNRGYNYDNPDLYQTIMTSDGKELDIVGQYHFISFESSYELDSLNLFSLGVTGNIGQHNASGNILNETYSQSGSLVSHYIDRIGQQGLWGGVTGNIDYQHSFGKRDHTLTASYRYEYNPNGSAYMDSILIDDEWLNAPFEGQRNENDSHAQEHTAQIDYVNPINDTHSIEGGAKYIVRLNHSNDDYQMLNGGLWQSIDQQQMLEYTQQILALYVGYGFKKSNWGFRLGGRYEATWIDAVLDKAGQHVTFGEPYGNFVPYAAINYNIDPMQTLRLSYTQRINRPGIGYLSPFEQWMSPVRVQYGNPNLKPEVSHTITAAYSIFKGVFNLNMQWTSRIANNSIQSYEFVDAKTGIYHDTYGNIGHTQSHGMSVYVSGQVTPKFNYSVNLGAYYKIYDAPTLNMKNSGWQANAGANINWMAWKGGSISAYGGIGSPWIGLQSSGSLPWYYYGLGISQRFLNDKLKVTLSANNPFTKYNRWRGETQGENFYSISEGGNRARNLQLSVTYTFGKLDAQVKKVNRGIVNEDLMNASQGQGGGGQGGGQ